ncbi:MAG: hypothetical protein O2816_01870 [Planctomycetota bacterium]|nr:hypothetical protein [Planctomycetota bacterium]
MGDRGSKPYRWIFVVFPGSQVQAGNAEILSDTLLLGLALPNVLGLYFLMPEVRRARDDNWRRLRSGAMDV